MGRYDRFRKEGSRNGRIRSSGGSRSRVGGSPGGTALLLVCSFLVLGAFAFVYANRSGNPAPTATSQQRLEEGATGSSGPSASSPSISPPATEGGLSDIARTQGFFEICVSVRTNCVVDGDTIWLNAQNVRVADIDAPEAGNPQCEFERQLADRATFRLMELLNEGPFEALKVGDRDEDRYGRKLRVLVRNGRSLGDQLVSEGLARTWTGRRRPWC